MKNFPKILLIPGDPSGIGYDIILDIARKNFQSKLIVIANIKHLYERAKLLKKKINFINVNINDKKIPYNIRGYIYVHNIEHKNIIKVGKPSTKNVPLILNSLDIAIDACIKNVADALVTGPVNKDIINKFGVSFYGHTEYIANKTGGEPIMMLHTKDLKIALLTTHIPLHMVPKYITRKKIESYIKIISKELDIKFGIKNPKINVCGLNPHSGENGYFGIEEKKIITPAIKNMQKKGYRVNGPYSADTIFLKKNSDIILAMFHDQALPVIKTLGFGNIVNTTLGLPIIRTSVDHGTATEIAGTNKANSASLLSAIETAITIIKKKNARKNKTK